VRLHVMEMNILRGILTNIEYNLKESPAPLNNTKENKDQ
jgi:hypothetical protein